MIEQTLERIAVALEKLVEAKLQLPLAPIPAVVVKEPLEVPTMTATQVVERQAKAVAEVVEDAGLDRKAIIAELEGLGVKVEGRQRTKYLADMLAKKKLEREEAAVPCEENAVEEKSNIDIKDIKKAAEAPAKPAPQPQKNPLDAAREALKNFAALHGTAAAKALLAKRGKAKLSDLTDAELITLIADIEAVEMGIS